MNMMHEFRKHIHTLALSFLFPCIFFSRKLKHCKFSKWGSENPTGNKRDEISLWSAAKTFECHHYYYGWPRFFFTIYCRSLYPSIFSPFFMRCVIANYLPMQNMVCLVSFGSVCHENSFVVKLEYVTYFCVHCNTIVRGAWVLAGE